MDNDIGRKIQFAQNSGGVDNFAAYDRSFACESYPTYDHTYDQSVSLSQRSSRFGQEAVGKIRSEKRSSQNSLGGKAKSNTFEIKRAHAARKTRRTESDLISVALENLGTEEFEETRVTRFRKFLGEQMSSQWYETLTGLVILSNFVLITLETDARAKDAELQDVEGAEVYQQQVLFFYHVADMVFMVFYTLECMARMFVMRSKFFCQGWNIFDLSIVLIGISCIALQHVLDSTEGERNANFFRSMRMVRLMRLPRLLVSFQELYALVCGLTNCMRTLLWAAALIFMMLTVYAIIAVEYIHPLMSALEEEGHYTYCTWCPGAFSSIMHANLTFFQIVSGDSWSFLCRALIEKHPWTALIFIALILTIVYGILNLVVAAIVDTAAQAREADIMTIANSRQKERDSAWESFSDLVHELDSDGDGKISLAELREGVETIPAFGALLSTMGVTMEDCITLFDVLDKDGNGIVTRSEFVATLSQMKTAHIPTSTFYIQHYVEDVRKMVMRNSQILDSLNNNQAVPDRKSRHTINDSLKSQSAMAICQSGERRVDRRTAVDDTIVDEMERMGVAVGGTVERRVDRRTAVDDSIGDEMEKIGISVAKRSVTGKSMDQELTGSKRRSTERHADRRTAVGDDMANDLSKIGLKTSTASVAAASRNDPNRSSMDSLASVSFGENDMNEYEAESGTAPEQTPKRSVLKNRGTGNDQARNTRTSEFWSGDDLDMDRDAQELERLVTSLTGDVTALTGEVQGLRGSLDSQLQDNTSLLQDMNRQLSELRDLSAPMPPPLHPGEDALKCSSVNDKSRSRHPSDRSDNRGSRLEVSVVPSSAPSNSRCCRPA